MNGCYKKYSREECDGNERARMAMNLNQPRSQHNYTEIGFKKLNVPKSAWQPLLQFWESNKDKLEPESWPPGNTYTNHWESPTYMVSLENYSLRGAGDKLKQTIWNAVRPVIQEWIGGYKLIETSMYGIRVYKENAVLATHVDRLPLVSSCIIQIAQDINEPWPVEVYDHAGKAHNVTMKPGEMVLYESHTVLHGRPFPLNGKFYANLFVHFIPEVHDDMNGKDSRGDIEGHNRHPFNSNNNKNIKVGGHEQSNHDEDEVRRHIDHEDKEQRNDLDVHKEVRVVRHQEEEEEYQRSEAAKEGEEEGDGDGEDPEMDFDGEQETEGVPPGLEGEALFLHNAASSGDMATIQEILSKFPDMVNSKDVNSWQPIHEAVRSGNLDVIELLINRGADLNGMTKNGGTPLWWAKRVLPEGDPIVAYLEGLGALEEGADL